MNSQLETLPSTLPKTLPITFPHGLYKTQLINFFLKKEEKKNDKT